MSAPGFGYSAGDFIAAATLIAKVTRSLKDAGGAREEYQALVGELDLLHQILARLQADPKSSTSDDPSLDDAFANFARQQTKVTLSELTRFLESISKFNSSMGEDSRSGWYRGMSRKTQWAVHYASEVQKMRVKLGTQLQIILVALSIGEKQKCRPYRVYDSDRFTRFMSSQPKQLTSTEQPKYATKDEIQTIVRDVLLSRTDRIMSKLEHMSTKADQPQAPMSSRCGTEEDDVKRLSVALLRAMAKSAHQLLLSLLRLLPQYITFIHVMSLTLRREPMLAAADCINFEDMIGRKFTLPFLYYKHWANFEAFLKTQFRDVPGQRHVKESQYRIVWGDVIVSEEQWPQIMKPGFDVEMSGLILSWKPNCKQCPRPACPGQGEQRGKESFSKCSACGLIYARDSGPQRLIEISEDFGDIKSMEAQSDDDEKYFRRFHVSWMVERNRRASTSGRNPLSSPFPLDDRQGTSSGIANLHEYMGRNSIQAIRREIQQDMKNVLCEFESDIERLKAISQGISTPLKGIAMNSNKRYRSSKSSRQVRSTQNER